MWHDTVSIVLKTIYWILVPAALLRLYMQWIRVPFRNPVGAFVCAVTDWLVLPLRRIVKGGAGIDWSSFLAACVLELGLAALFDVLVGRLALFSSAGALSAWLVNGAFGLVVTVLTMILWITIACAVFSWVRAESPVADVLDAVSAPWLKPIRRRMPMVGGFDLSPLVLLVAVQIALVAVARMQVLVIQAIR